MLSNRSRTVTSKQALMGSLQSPTQNQSKPNSSFFGSPRFFNGFLSKGISDAEAAVMSPTSILDTKLFTNFVNPFGHDKNLSKPPNTSPQNKQLCGLALVDSLIDDKSSEDASKPNTRMILFGSKLKIQIPVTQSEISSSNSPKSPADFGIKTRNSSASGIVNSCVQTNDSPKVSTGGLSLREIELSEDYTCVISHGPIPKTTHIYDNCIVESCYGVAELPPVKKKKNFNSPSQNFLSLCHTCKKRLGEDRDIFMYGGDKAFCSYECRCKEMLYDEMSNSEFEDPFN